MLTNPNCAREDIGCCLVPVHIQLGPRLAAAMRNKYFTHGKSVGFPVCSLVSPLVSSILPIFSHHHSLSSIYMYSFDPTSEVMGISLQDPAYLTWAVLQDHPRFCKGQHFSFFEIRSHHVAQTDLEFMLLLPLAPECWVFRHTVTCTV